MKRKILLSVPEEIRERIRLDVFLTNSDIGYSRSGAQRLIAEGHVEIEGRTVKPGHPVRPGDVIRVVLPEPKAPNLNPEAIPLDVFFEDRDLLVVNKPAGMVVHPAPGSYSGTLVHALLHHCTDLSGIGGQLRPGIVHRLDKGTSGLLIVAKNDGAHWSLSDQLKRREVVRRYRALVWGRMAAPSGRIEASIGRHPADGKRMAVSGRRARPAATRFKVEEEFEFLSLLSLRLETGRTHQIRVHLSHVGHPVFGDPTYGGREKRLRGIAPRFRTKAEALLKIMPRQALHAQTLGFVHPTTDEQLSFSSDLPEDIRAVLTEAKAFLQ